MTACQTQGRANNTHVCHGSQRGLCFAFPGPTPPSKLLSAMDLDLALVCAGFRRKPCRTLVFPGLILPSIGELKATSI